VDKPNNTITELQTEFVTIELDEYRMPSKVYMKGAPETTLVVRPTNIKSKNFLKQQVIIDGDV